jgi:hypothetical protein
MKARLVLAIAVLGVLAGLLIENVLGMRFARNPISQWSLPIALVLVGTILGLVARSGWARWVGLAAGVTTTIIAGFLLLFTNVPSLNQPRMLAFFLGPVLLLSLSGRRMFAAFEGKDGSADDARRKVVRWAVVTNIASLAALLFENILFVRELAKPAFTGSVVLSVSAMAALLLGVVLLARGKTAGLLVLAGGCVALVTSLFQVPAMGPDTNPALIMLVASVAPGLIFGLLAAAIYARPIWRFLRA